jgi:hypothetical protein
VDRPVLPAVPRTLNPGVLVAELYGKHRGIPILVVGGGPSAPDELAAIGRERVKAMIVISANSHAWQLGLRPDYTFCKDHLHTETKQPMEVLVRAGGAPVVSMQYWADYRCARWPIQGNSGQHAIALAALMGGAPIVPIGIDCFQGETYFHTPNIPNVSLGRSSSYWKSRFTRLQGRLEGAAVRPVGGILGGAFPLYRPYEEFARVTIPSIFDSYVDCPTEYVRAVRRFVLPQDPRAEIPVGFVLPATPLEAALFIRQGVAVSVSGPTT